MEGCFDITMMSTPGVSRDNDSQDLIAQAAELEAMGISVIDQHSLERNVEAAVDNAVIKHARKQKLNGLKRDLKHTQITIKQANIKLDNLESRSTGMKSRFVDPRKLLEIEKDIKEKKEEIKGLINKENHLKDRISTGEQNETDLDKYDGLDLEDGEIIDDEDMLTQDNEPATTQSIQNIIKDTKSGSQKIQLMKDNLVSMGEMTPFGTVIKESSQHNNVKLSRNNSFEQYLQDQINKQNNIYKQRKSQDTQHTSTNNVLSVHNQKKAKKKIKEFKGSKFTSTKSKKEPIKSVKKSPLKKEVLHPKKKLHSNVGSKTSTDESDRFMTPRRPLSETVALESPIDSDASDYHNESGSEYMPSDHSDQDVSNFSITEPKKRKRKKDSEGNTSKTDQKRTKVKSRDDGNYDNYVARIKSWMKEKTRAKHEKIINEENVDSDEDDENKYEEFEGGYRIPYSVWSKLYKYQKTCVRWLWELHGQNAGGILGDEMGLGKTIQIISFLVGLSYSRLYCSDQPWRGLGPVLIVAPATVLHQWVKEIHKWWPPFRVAVLHDSGSYTGTPQALISNINKNCGLLIISYTGIRQHLKTLLHFPWHYLILDEGHKIRNPEAQITVAVKRFQTPHRLILSGSPIQNNLKELWSLFDFIFPGKLGTLPVFMTEFSVPITQGGYANANKIEVQTAFKCACILRDTINPYLLRRMKNDVRDHLSLPDKNEQVLFCGLSDEQRGAYKQYIDSREVQTILGGRLKVFVGLINLRKICNHPDLYTGGPRYGDEDSGLQPEIKYGWWGRSGKMRVLQSILKLWSKQEHKVLLFTQSKQMLCILERFLLDQGHTYIKMDGGTAVSSRQTLIEKYNKDPSIFVFLLTTRVGGLGVNLTGADRIVIYDPDWNPSTDTQARERAWRIGQLRHVTIYRLLTAGTIEEKIYHRQIFKQFITNRVLKDPKQQRFFKSNSLYELFQLNEGLKEKTESSSLFAGLGSEIKVDKNSKQTNSSNGKESLNSSKDDVISDEQNKNVVRIKNKSDQIQTDNDTKSGDVYNDTILDLTKSDISSDFNKDIKNYVDNETTASLSKEESEVIDKVSNDKRERMLEKAKLLSKMLSSSVNSKPNSSIVKETSCSKDKSRKKKTKGKKFEGERIEYLVKKRHWKYSEEEENTKSKNESQDQYVLAKLFQKSGVHTAMSHDKIMNAGDPDYLLLEAEAEKVAKKAIKNVRASRALCFKPTLPKKVEPKFGNKKKIINSLQQNTEKDLKSKPESSNVFKASHIEIEEESDFGSNCSSSHTTKVGKIVNNNGESSGAISSSELIARMKARNRISNEEESESDTENSEYPSLQSKKEVDVDFQENMDLLADIRNFIAFQAEVDGRASTKEIISRFKDRLPPERSHIFKALLKEICDFSRQSDNEGYWYIKGEFR